MYKRKSNVRVLIICLFCDLLQHFVRRLYLSLILTVWVIFSVKSHFPHNKKNKPMKPIILVSCWLIVYYYNMCQFSCRSDRSTSIRYSSSASLFHYRVSA